MVTAKRPTMHSAATYKTEVSRPVSTVPRLANFALSERCIPANYQRKSNHILNIMRQLLVCKLL